MSHIGKHIYKPQLVVLKYKSVVVCYRGSVYAKYVHAHLKKTQKFNMYTSNSNQINQFHEKNFFYQIPFFAISKMAKNQFSN